MIPEPPALPQIQGMAPEIQKYFKTLDQWVRVVYTTLQKIDIGGVKISTGTDAPTGGEDGDLYIRVAAASTKLYLNINGTFSGYTNP